MVGYQFKNESKQCFILHKKNSSVLWKRLRKVLYKWMISLPHHLCVHHLECKSMTAYLLRHLHRLHLLQALHLLFTLHLRYYHLPYHLYLYLHLYLHYYAQQDYLHLKDTFYLWFFTSWSFKFSSQNYRTTNYSSSSYSTSWNHITYCYSFRRAMSADSFTSSTKVQLKSRSHDC